MLFAVTYGSAGDILDTAKLAIEVIRRLRNGSRLSQERLDLATELQDLYKDLISLSLIASNVHIDPACPHSLHIVDRIRSEVDSCRRILTQFLFDKLAARKGAIGTIIEALWEDSATSKLRKDLSRPLKAIRTSMLTLILLVPFYFLSNTRL